MKKYKLNFYLINEDYLEYLKKYDKNVPVKTRRPFVGIVLNIHNKTYYAPLFSPKKKHKKMKDTIDFMKIKNRQGNEIIGAINLNNMIPVVSSQIKYLDISKVSNDFYRELLRNQFNWCNKKDKKIRENAEKLYNEVQKENSIFKKRCCDFKKLEMASVKYKNHKEKKNVLDKKQVKVKKR